MDCSGNSVALFLNLYPLWSFPTKVRDVLKGILKPSTLLDEFDMKIKDNHYPEEPPATAATLMSENSRRHHYTQQQSTVSTPNVDTSSGAESSSPEYSEDIRRPADASQTVSSHSSPSGEDKERYTTSTLLHLSNSKEIELAEINKKNQEVANSIPNDVAGQKVGNGHRGNENSLATRMTQSWTRAQWWGN